MAKTRGGRGQQTTQAKATTSAASKANSSSGSVSGKKRRRKLADEASKPRTRSQKQADQATPKKKAKVGRKEATDDQSGAKVATRRQSTRAGDATSGKTTESASWTATSVTAAKAGDALTGASASGGRTTETAVSSGNTASSGDERDAGVATSADKAAPGNTTEGLSSPATNDAAANASDAPAGANASGEGVTPTTVSVAGEHGTTVDGDEQIRHGTAVSSNDGLSEQPAGVTSEPELTPEEIRIARPVLKKMLERIKAENKHSNRRFPFEPFKLSFSQIMLLVDRYQAARNAGRSVDYEQASTNKNFSSFARNADKLRAKEGEVIAWIRKALREKRAKDAGERVKTTEEWQAELAKGEARHQTLMTEQQEVVDLLRGQLAYEKAASSALREKLTRVKDKLRKSESGQREVTATSDATGDDNAAKQLQDLRGKLDEQAAKQTERNLKLNDWSYKLSQRGMALDEKQHALITTEQELKDERGRLNEEQIKLNEWERRKDVVMKEYERQVCALKEQAKANGYAVAVTKWREVYEAEQEATQAVKAELAEWKASSTLARRDEDFFRRALEDEHREVVRLQNAAAALELKLASYPIAGVTERKIDNFVRERVSSYASMARTERRAYVVEQLKRIDATRAATLAKQFTGFANTRNNLAHDGDGTEVEDVGHQVFQDLCGTIQDTMDKLETEIPKYVFSRTT